MKRENPAHTTGKCYGNYFSRQPLPKKRFDSWELAVEIVQITRMLQLSVWQNKCVVCKCLRLLYQLLATASSFIITFAEFILLFYYFKFFCVWNKLTEQNFLCFYFLLQYVVYNDC